MESAKRWGRSSHESAVIGTGCAVLVASVGILAKQYFDSDVQVAHCQKAQGGKLDGSSGLSGVTRKQAR